MRVSCNRALSAILLAFLLTATSASAQVSWWRVDDNTAVTLEWSKANFPDEAGDELGMFNTVGFLGAQVRVSNSLSLVGELPFSTWDVKHPARFGDDWYWYDWEDEKMIGNPFVGLEYAAPGSMTFLRVGARIPLASDDKYFATIMGYYGATDRFEAFWPELWTVSLAGGIRAKTETGLVYQFLIGPTALVPDQGDAELLTDYSGFVGYTGSLTRLGLQVGGRFLITESTEEFSGRFDHFLGAVVGLRLGNFEPGLHFRYAFDKENRELADFMYGINLAVNFGGAFGD